MYQLEDEDKENQDDEADDDAEVRRELRRVEKAYDPAREGGFSTSSSESESEEESGEQSSADEEDEELEVVDGDVVEEVQEADVHMGEVSARLAAVNLDWDNIRAEDLMAVASSFAPPDGRIENVSVYPSEFGRERIEREELEGPPKEIFASTTTKNADAASAEDYTSSDDDADERIRRQLQREDKGEDFDSTALRAYQLERLRYYYAVLTCSSPSTAKALYDAMDGREYLSSANFFDLRFVPDSVSFDDDKPRDTCDRVPDGYRPNEFVTDALTHSKVRLTWDADDRTRKEVQKRAFSRKEIDENDLAAYVGSDTSDEEEEDAAIDGDGHANGASSKSAKERKAAALRAALGLSAEPISKSSSKKDNGPVGNMQVTFSSGLSSAPIRGSVFENEPIIEETTKEKYVRKEKERKARRKERAKAARAGASGEAVDDDDQAAAAASNRKASTDAAAEGGGEEEADPFDDPFFTDPTGSAARAGAKKLQRAERARKREEREAEAKAAAARRAELELLMADDEDAAGNARHFDMAEVAREEKAKRKKKKGKKAGRAEEEDGGRGEAREGFEMDVEDPRFARLFERHEFAIDPTNPRFKGTGGMKALLEEGRKKRKGRGGEEDGGDGGMGAKGKRSKVGDGEEAGEDIERLVQRVKGKVKGNVRA